MISILAGFEMARTGERTEAGERTYTRQVKGGTLKSQLQATEKWERENPKDRIYFRVPAGAKELIENYVREKAEAEPDNPMYSTFNGKGLRPSVNAFVVALIERETGIKLT